MQRPGEQSGGHRPPRASEFAAFREFCECAYRPSEKRVAKVLATDWSAYPRLRNVLASLPEPVTPGAMAATALRLLSEAIGELEDLFPPREGHVTPLEVFEMHVLEARPWPSIQALLTEQGRPHARGTLISRQKELLPYLLEWMQNGSSLAEEPPPLAPETENRTWPKRVLAVAGAVVLLGAAGIFVERWLNPPEPVSTVELVEASVSQIPTPSFIIPPEIRGRRIPGSLDGGGTLEEPCPPFEVPDLQGGRLTGLLLEETPGEPRILISSEPMTEPAPILCLWDPASERQVWTTSFVPPARERITHTTVGAEVVPETYYTANMFHAGREGDLDPYAAVVLQQKYSPTFVVWLDIRTGDVLGYYVHPGHISNGIVVDIDGDGAYELVLAGQDNALNVPAVVALHPREGRRVASTVLWNESRQEGARARVLLPSWPEALETFHSMRLSVASLNETDFDYSGRVLTVEVGAGGQPLYHARFGPGLAPTPNAPLLLWDSDLLTIREYGLARPDLARMSEEIVFLENPDL